MRRPWRDSKPTAQGGLGKDGVLSPAPLIVALRCNQSMDDDADCKMPCLPHLEASGTTLQCFLILRLKLTAGQLWVASDQNFPISISNATWYGCRGAARGRAYALLLGAMGNTRRMRRDGLQSSPLVWMRLQYFMQPSEKGYGCCDSERVQGGRYCAECD
ncbi:hypothetical protein LZ32DRAFT_28103 [Colletotrichum eremochloae]|nr:hypothetical protein LZ32DRAFT_28103 [Colletotrichum eremochloae]